MDTYQPKHLLPAEHEETAEMQLQSDSTLMQSLARRAVALEQLPSLDTLRGPNDDVREFLEECIVGQQPAIDTIVTALDRRHARTDEKPIASLLFLGPTGVGKTETVKTLLEAFRDRGLTANLVTIDCASLSSNHEAAAYLLGSPAGYIGYKDKPKFDAQNFASPYEERITILLLDEIEKAAPALYKVLMPVFDEGRAQLRDGSETSFANTIIIATSNVGAGEMNKLMTQRVGFTFANDTATPDVASIRAAAMRGLNEHFKTMPEFLGRFGEPVVFQPHDRNGLRLVLECALAQRNDELRDRFGVEVEMSAAVMDTLVDDVLPDNHLGARPLIHALEDRILSAAGRYMGSGHLVEGYRLRVHHGFELHDDGDTSLVFSVEADDTLIIPRFGEFDEEDSTSSDSADAADDIDPDDDDGDSMMS